MISKNKRIANPFPQIISFGWLPLNTFLKLSLTIKTEKNSHLRKFFVCTKNHFTYSIYLSFIYSLLYVMLIINIQNQNLFLVFQSGHTKFDSGNSASTICSHPLHSRSEATTLCKSLHRPCFQVDLTYIDYNIYKLKF